MNRIQTHIFTIIALIAILSLGFWVRMNSFWLPHWEGDQSQYIALAMKMNHTEGLSGYNLREVRLDKSFLPSVSGYHFIVPTYQKDTDGDLISAYKKFGLEYYNMPFWYKGPVLPYILNLSHNLFVGSGKPFMISNSNLGKAVFKFKPRKIYETQFWLAIVPIFFSLVIIAVIFLIARTVCSNHSSLAAAFIFAVHPVDILCSHRIWTEDLQVAFLWMALLFFWVALHGRTGSGLSGGRVRDYLLPALSGMFLGLSVLTNQKSLIFIPGMWFYGFLMQFRSGAMGGSLIKKGLYRKFLVLTAVLLAVCGWWFVRIFQEYGTPLYEPDFSEILSESVNAWVGALNERPISIIVYVIGGIFLSPPVLLGFSSVINLFGSLKKFISGSREHSIVLYIWCVVFPLMSYLFIFGYQTPEHRYFLPILPGIAILSGFVLDCLNSRIRPYFKSYSHMVIGQWILLGLCGFWSVPKAWSVIVQQKNLIQIPF